MTRKAQNDINTLRQGYADFHMMRLPGQPQSMHMGTSALVSALMQEVDRLHEQQSVLMNSLDHCIEFLADMHALPREWTVAESQKLHSEICSVMGAAVRSNRGEDAE